MPLYIELCLIAMFSPLFISILKIATHFYKFVKSGMESYCSMHVCMHAMMIPFDNALDKFGE